MQPLTHSPTFPQSPEALDAVLGRFQEWTSSRKTSRDHGLREVTYQEAVNANRRRWQPAKKRTENDRLQAEPGVIPVAAPAASHAAVSHPADKPNRKERSSKRRKKDSAAGKTARQGKKVETSGAEKPGPVQLRKAQPAPPHTAFRTVLAEAITPEPVATRPATTALTHPRQLEAERQVTLSLRMAPSEQALIRARAAAAGVSTSAYLRQCALEVGQLREQMRQTLALIGQSAAIAVSSHAQMQPPMQAPQPGFLERLRQVFLGGRPARNLSLRA